MLKKAKFAGLIFMIKFSPSQLSCLFIGACSNSLAISTVWAGVQIPSRSVSADGGQDAALFAAVLSRVLSAALSANAPANT